MCIEVKDTIYMEQYNLVESYQLFRSIGSRGIEVGIANTLDNKGSRFGKKVFPSDPFCD